MTTTTKTVTMTKRIGPLDRNAAIGLVANLDWNCGEGGKFPKGPYTSYVVRHCLTVTPDGRLRDSETVSYDTMAEALEARALHTVEGNEVSPVFFTVYGLKADLDSEPLHDSVRFEDAELRCQLLTSLLTGPAR